MESKEVPEREMIVFNGKVDWQDSLGGTKRFDGLEVEKCRELIDKGYMDAESTQNCSPRMGDIVEWMEEINEWSGLKVTAHGYMVDPERSDKRVTLEGVRVESKRGDLPREVICDFGEMFRCGDEINMTPKSLYVWFD